MHTFSYSSIIIRFGLCETDSDIFFFTLQPTYNNGAFVDIELPPWKILVSTTHLQTVYKILFQDDYQLPRHILLNLVYSGKVHLFQR